MQDTGKPEAKKLVKKLVLSSHSRAALINERSNFITQTKTVVVHNQQTVVVDSPERVSKNRGGLTTSSGVSLASIGMRHFQQQKDRLSGAPQTNNAERRGSQFLTTGTANPPNNTSSKSFGIGALGATAFSTGISSRPNSIVNSGSIQSNGPVSSGTGLMSLSEKFRARTLQKQNAATTTTSASTTSSLGQLQRSLSSGDNSARGEPVTSHTLHNAPATNAHSGVVYNTNNTNISYSEHDISNHANASNIAASATAAAGVSTESTTSRAANAISTAHNTTNATQSAASGLGGLFQGMGRTMAVKSVVAAPVKSVKFDSHASADLARMSSTSAGSADAALYGAHNVGAAESVGTYLDTVMPAKTSSASVSSGGSGGAKGGSGKGSAKSKSTAAVDGEGQAEKEEKADSFNNFVRKNLKSGGSSKKLNHTTGRTSMAKQRWINRQGEGGGGGGGKYGKFKNKGKYGGSGGGGGGGNDDTNTTNGSSGTNSYSKPRGLQQWGLDALEMSLNLLEGSPGDGTGGESGGGGSAAEGSVEIVGAGSTAGDNSIIAKEGGGGQGIVLYDSEDSEDGSEGSGSEMEVEVEVHVQPTTPTAASGGAGESACTKPRATKPSSSRNSTPTNNTTQNRTPYPIPATATTKHTTTSTTSTRGKLSKYETAALKAQTKATQRQAENERVTAMTVCAPKCPGHSMPSKLLVVKKSGANKGKYFYSCTFPSEQRCNFFMWAEDNPELLDKTAAHHTSRPALLPRAHHTQQHSTATPADPAALQAEAKLEYELYQYQAKLKTFNSAELKAEVLKISQRLRLAGCASKMGVTGTKEELIERLLIEASRILTGTTGSADYEGDGDGGVASSRGRGKGGKVSKGKGTANRRSQQRKKAVTVTTMSSSSDGEGSGDNDSSDGDKRGSTMRGSKSGTAAKVRTVCTAIPTTQAPSGTEKTGGVASAEEVVEVVQLSSRRSSRLITTTSITPTTTHVDGDRSSEHELCDTSDDDNNNNNHNTHANTHHNNNNDSSDDGDVGAVSDTESVLLDAAVEVRVGRSGAAGDSGDSSGESGSDESGSEGGSIDWGDSDSIDSGSGGESENEMNAYENEHFSDSSAEHTTRNSNTRNKTTKRPVSKKSKISATTAVAKSHTKRGSKGGKYSEEEEGNVGEMDTSAEMVPTDPLELLLRASFGFSTFRPGQRWAMQRCLEGRSSLLVMPTGAGKSLCYMLPSVALPGLTVVVSPLVALMQDQLRKLPLGLTGACLSGSLTAQEMMRISEAVLRGHVKVLYVSPERLCTPSFRRLITLLKQQQLFQRAQSRQTSLYNSDSGSVEAHDQPVVSLLCVDEAHCLSQWSYNFRPAFLRIRREVQFIQPAAVLALTATATPRIQHDVMRHLGIPLSDGLMALPVRRDNLQVTVHLVEDEEQRRGLIVDLVKDPRIVTPPSADSNTDSNINGGADTAVGSKRVHSALTSAKGRAAPPPLSIVYVWRRFEADSLAEYLRAAGVPGVAIYHAGIDAGTRARTQIMFDRGKVRCIVATVAFGMGVDKSDVRQVIHCTMPKSIESYMQEMGRAGRDGAPAACHLLLQREDAVLQHSLSHSMQLSHVQIASLLLKVFLPNDSKDSGSGNTNAMHKYIAYKTLHADVSLLLDPLEASLDINSTVAETIMSVLELPPYNLLIVDGTHFDVIKGRFRTSTEQLSSDVLVSALLALNTIKPNVDVLDKEFKPAQSNGMNDSYGLGFDCSASAANQGFSADDDHATHNTSATATNSSGWERDRKVSGSYGGKIVDFECSRLAVALHSSLTPDEVSTGLYKLQRSGVLEYKLQDSALYLKVLPYTPYSGASGNNSSYSSDKCSTEHHFDAYCAQLTSSGSAQDRYFAWVWRLACSVYCSLQRIASGGSHRICDMWRTGATIAHYTSKSSGSADKRGGIGRANKGTTTNTSTTPVSAAEAVAVHSAAQSLLSYVMSDADGSNSNTSDSANSTDSTTPEEEEELYAQMKSMYLDTPPPFTNVLSSQATSDTAGDAKAVAAVNKLRDKLRTDVHVLQRDPNLLTAVNTLLRQAAPLLAHQAALDMRSDAQSIATNSASITNITASVQEAKKGLLALCMCRILHALPTRLLPATAWRDRSDAWGSHKDVEFDQLLEFIIEELR